MGGFPGYTISGLWVALFTLEGQDVAPQCQAYVIVLPSLSPAVGKIKLPHAVGVGPRMFSSGSMALQSLSYTVVDLTIELRVSQLCSGQPGWIWCFLWGGPSMSCGATRGNRPICVVYVLGVVYVCCLQYMCMIVRLGPLCTLARQQRDGHTAGAASDADRASLRPGVREGGFARACLGGVEG